MRPAMRGWVLKWLRGVTTACAARYPEPADHAGALEALARLRGCDGMGGEVRDAIDRAAARLEGGSWRPRMVLDHNDLWPGNIMANRDAAGRAMGASGYVVIDWAGANLRGGGFADLLRCARGFNLTPRQLRVEIEFHCRTLGLQPEDATSQLLLSLGWLHQNLEHFPIERFVELSVGIFQLLHVSVQAVYPPFPADRDS
jgi:hypothetical protein